MEFVYACGHDERTAGRVPSSLYDALLPTMCLEGPPSRELRVICPACFWKQPREAGRAARLTALEGLDDAPEAPTTTLSLFVMLAHTWAGLRRSPTAEGVYTPERWTAAVAAARAAPGRAAWGRRLGAVVGDAFGHWARVDVVAATTPAGPRPEHRGNVGARFARALAACRDLPPDQRRSPGRVRAAVEALVVAGFAYSAALVRTPGLRDLRVATLQRRLPADGAFSDGGVGLRALAMCMEQAAHKVRVFKVQLYRLTNSLDRLSLDGGSGPDDLLGLGVCVGLLENAARGVKGYQERRDVLWKAWRRWASKYEGVVTDAREAVEAGRPE